MHNYTSKLNIFLFKRYEYYRGKYGVIFDSLDFSHSKLISEWDFLLWMRVSSPSIKTPLNLSNLFSNEADWYSSDQEEKFMSFRRFAEVCEINDLFTIQMIESFKRNVTDEYKEFTTLRRDWDIKFNYMKSKLIISKVYSRLYAKLMNTMDKWFDHMDTTTSDAVIWMRYRICDEEGSIQILNTETEKMIPNQFLLLHRLSKCLLD